MLFLCLCYIQSSLPKADESPRPTSIKPKIPGAEKTKKIEGVIRPFLEIHRWAAHKNRASIITFLCDTHKEKGRIQTQSH